MVVRTVKAAAEGVGPVSVKPLVSVKPRRPAMTHHTYNYLRAVTEAHATSPETLTLHSQMIDLAY